MTHRRPYRLLITGSRTFTLDHERRTVADILDGTAPNAAVLGYTGLVVVHGDCPRGADQAARNWAVSRKGRGWPVDHEPHPADWDTNRGAGRRRNLAMVRSGADGCLAFIDVCDKRRCDRRGRHASHGATHCAGAAELAGIPTARHLSPALYALTTQPPAGGHHG